MPAGAVQHQHRMRASGHLRADLLEMLVHRLGVYRRHDDGGTEATVRTDRTEQVRGIMATVPHHQRARANRCPNIGVRSSIPSFLAGRQSAEQQRLAAWLIAFFVAAHRLVSAWSIGPTNPPRMRLAYLV